MKVLNVTTRLDPIKGGGTAERTIQMSLHLKAENECTIMTHDLGLTAEVLKPLEGIEIVALLCLSERYPIPLLSLNKIKRSVKNADIIHLMNHWTIANAIVYILARRFNKPFLLCPAGSILTFHKSRLLKVLYNLIIGKRIVRNASGLIAITSNEISEIEYYGIDPRNVVVIPNGINEHDYKIKDDAGFRAKYGLLDNPIVLFVGRLNHIKGPDLLLKAFCRLKDKFPSYQLVFAGADEGMLPELKRITAKNGVEDRVHFIGYIYDKNKSKAFNAAELIAIPSRREAMSIVVLEAGITSTPVLITDRCGFGEIEKIGGGTVVPASVEGLQMGLDYMFSAPEEMKIMGENFNRYVKDRYSWKSLIKIYLNLFKKILNENRGSV